MIEHTELVLGRLRALFECEHLTTGERTTIGLAIEEIERFSGIEQMRADAEFTQAFLPGLEEFLKAIRDVRILNENTLRRVDEILKENFGAGASDEKTELSGDNSP